MRSEATSHWCEAVAGRWGVGNWAESAVKEVNTLSLSSDGVQSHMSPCCHTRHAAIPAATCLHAAIPAATCLHAAIPVATCLHAAIPVATCLHAAIPVAPCSDVECGRCPRCVPPPGSLSSASDPDSTPPPPPAQHRPGLTAVSPHAWRPTHSLTCNRQGPVSGYWQRIVLHCGNPTL